MCPVGMVNGEGGVLGRFSTVGGGVVDGGGGGDGGEEVVVAAV